MSTSLLTAPALAASIARVKAVNEYLPDIAVGIPTDPDWVTVAEVFGPDQTILRGMMAAAQAAYNSDRGDYGGMSVMGQYSWVLTAVVIGAYQHDLLVPDLSLDNVAIHLGEHGGGDAIGFVTGAVTVVAGTAAADDEQATVVPAADLTLTAVRRRLEAHFAPIVDAIRAAAPIGKRALWLSVADMCANALVRDGEAGADSEALVAAFCRQAGSPLKGGTRVLTLHHGGTDHRFIERGSCCLHHTVPEGSHCTTCPLRQRDDRIGRLVAYLDSLASEAATAAS